MRVHDGPVPHQGVQHGKVVEEGEPVLPHATLNQVSSSTAEAVQQAQWKGLSVHGRRECKFVRGVRWNEGCEVE